ncbi:MAG TPA: LuxR C-terminal-related transcriptional regulator [Capillimicrobium sp.]|jgi:DNA-binding CsgD family transcriptional regulator
MDRLDESFWRVFARSRTPMLLCDDEPRYREANLAALDCLGRPRAEVVGQPLGRRAAAELRPRVPTLYAEMLRRGHATLPWAIERPDGERREVFLHLVSAVLPDRHLVAFLTSPPELPAGGLTPREREVTRLLADGCDGEQIARALTLSPETVRTHVRNAMERVGARTRSHLVAIAIRERLIEP